MVATVWRVGLVVCHTIVAVSRVFPAHEDQIILKLSLGFVLDCPFSLSLSFQPLSFSPCTSRRAQATGCRQDESVGRGTAGGTLSRCTVLVLFVFRHSPVYMENDDNFVIAILAAVNLNLFGFWCLLIYLRFRRVPSSSSSACTPATPGSGVIKHVKQQQSSRQDTQVVDDLEPCGSSSSFSKTRTSAGPGSTRKATNNKRRLFEEFNIFDGSSPTSTLAGFVFQGDEEDAEHDAAESRKWNDIQTHV